MTFASPIAAVIVAILGLVICFRTRSDRATRLLVACGASSIALAAGEPTLNGSRPADVVVMIDDSPSTRGAAYHDASQLNKRVTQLLPNAQVRTVHFSDPLARSTQWIGPVADATLLFSDGQFEFPDHVPPTWPVIDPQLAAPVDAAVQDVTSSKDGSEVATVSNSGRERTLSGDRGAHAIPAGGATIVVEAAPPAAELRLNSADLWPENDALIIPPADQIQLQRWWIGDHPPAGWLPAPVANDLTAFASAGVVAVPDAASLSPTQQAMLSRYVTDLGGSLLLIDSPLNTMPALASLSPLSFESPKAARRWIILLDASGSMSQRDGTVTRFEAACAAVREMLVDLPANDSLAIGFFARDLTWWSTAGTIADGRAATWPPPNVQPSGPTNLESVLGQLLAGGSVDLTSNIVVVTDSEAPVGSAEQLGLAFKSKGVALNMLSIDAANPSLSQLTAASGGRLLNVGKLAEINSAASQFASNLLPPPTRLSPLRFEDSLRLPSREAAPIRAAWSRENASSLATGADSATSAAEWQRGLGRVVALAFVPTPTELETLANRIERQPADPRIFVLIEKSCVRVDASGLANCNNRRFELQIDNEPPFLIEQTAPGRYATNIEPADQARRMTLTLDGAVIRRQVIPPHYAAEFDAIGTNVSRLQAIAKQSGGKVIEPDDSQPITLPRVRRDYALASPLAAVGVIAWLLALIRRKL